MDDSEEAFDDEDVPPAVVEASEDKCPEEAARLNEATRMIFGGRRLFSSSKVSETKRVALGVRVPLLPFSWPAKNDFESFEIVQRHYWWQRELERDLGRAKGLYLGEFVVVTFASAIRYVPCVMECFSA